MADETKEFPDAELISEYTLTREGPNGEPITQSGKATVGTGDAGGAGIPELPFYDIDVFELGELRGMHEINVLPDWVRIAMDGIFSYMVPEASIALVGIYEEAFRIGRDGGNYGTNYRRVATLSADQDTILRSLYPDSTFYDDPTFLTLDYNFTGPRDGPDELLPAGNFHDHFTGRYFLQVETLDQEDFVLPTFGSYAFTQRYAVGVDLSTGLRASEWGSDWVNLGVLTPPPPPPEPVSTLPPEAALVVVNTTPETLQVETRPWHHDENTDQWSLPATDTQPEFDLGEQGEGEGAFSEEVPKQFFDKFVGFIDQLKKVSETAGDGEQVSIFQGIYDVIDRVDKFKDVILNSMKNAVNTLQNGIENLGKPGFDNGNWFGKADQLAPQAQEEIAAPGEDNLNDATKDKFKGVVGWFMYQIKHSDVSAGMRFSDGSAPSTIDLANGHNNAAIGGNLDETFNGGDLADLIAGGGGADTINGNGGNDVLGGGTGIDKLYGGMGDDTFVLRENVLGETFDGGPGFDTLEIHASSRLWGNTLAGIEHLKLASEAGWSVNPGIWFEQMAYSGVTQVSGGAGIDQLTIYLPDGGGTYTMPNLVISGFTPPPAQGEVGDLVILRAGTTGNYTLYAREGLASRQYLGGGPGNDTLIGSSGSESLHGGGGGVNQLMGLGGDDLLQINNSNSSTGVLSTWTGAGSTFDGGHGFDLLLIGGPVNLQGTLIGLEGFRFDEAFDSTAPNNGYDQPATLLTIASTRLDPLPANLLLSGIGTMIVNVVAGDSYDASSYVVAPGASITHVVNGSTAGDTISGLQIDDTLNGGDGNDTLRGNGGNDMLRGGSGADRMEGGTGDDTYEVDATGDRVTEQAGQGLDLVQASISFELGANVENLTLTGSGNTAGAGNALANVLTGNSGNNWLVGLAGNDVLDGGSGSDRMEGGADNDIYRVDNTRDRVNEKVNEGTDLVQASITFELGANVENLTLTGSGNTAGGGNALANVLTGNSGNNWLAGVAGNDTLDGGLGGDRMDGGADNDTYHVDNTGDRVNEKLNEGTDHVISSITFQLGANLENLTLTGSGPTSGAGNALANMLTGNSGNNWLAGLAGNDVLDGGLGADKMEGGADNDTYSVDNAGDRVNEKLNEGTDHVLSSISFELGANVENLTLTGSGNTSGAGNALANLLTGNSGSNWLVGLAGNDVLDGGAGSDRMEGGADNDWYYVDNAGDRVTESVSGGAADRVFASVSYTLGAGVYVEQLTTNSNGATAAINLTGNELANSIYGNAGANVLDGKGGIDTLFGLAGQDTFAFTTALGGGNVDTISDFSVADDTIRLENAVFTGLAAGVLAAGAFNTGAAATQADDRIIYNSATGALLFDADGLGGAAAVQFATLGSGLSLGASDFLVI